ncbi:type II CRISPR RNA-guided endonuclease Cas9 [Streptococcus danieliae]|uniref:type II CRISPR RNA-guided endonuclease Cas9 n=1 Tax=Streptococcus danieliae TaxID=747656 RepID=UPI0021C81483|nr:type II CRISPR RNA-guided endonuclease Cas9 [Streptococcus danieliae]MCU0082567.1 type II CRISPR RNA-guided endonuclease Cas9 [Streptococcus danieliae]
MTKIPYSIGLDIGTNSVGWAVLTDDYKVPTKKMRVRGNTDKQRITKNLIGSYLFDAGETAADRRSKRIARRRYTRRKKRLIYLQDIFQPEMSRVDENFFHRLRESFLQEEDKQYEKYPLFGTKAEEQAYYQQYPTIYHLRHELANKTDKADLRHIYLALAHMVKYRGHFLIEGEFKLGEASLIDSLRDFFEEYGEKFELDLSNLLQQDTLEQLETILTVRDPKSARKDKAKELVSKILGPKVKLEPFFKLMVGLESNLKAVFDLEDAAKLDLSKESYEEDVAALLEILGADYEDLFTYIGQIHHQIILNGLIIAPIGDKAPLSASMVARYEQHKQQLADFKEFVRSEYGKKVYDEFFHKGSKKGYTAYIGNSDDQSSKLLSQDSFYKEIKKLIGENPAATPFKEAMDKEEFLLKQRTFENGKIPNQLHLLEFRAILEQQAIYYPFLKAEAEKLESILTFRIPYYVGPLAQEGQSPFAWMEHKKSGAIRPWNFEELVDKEASAEKFIKNMTVRDTYLPDEMVLPKHSLLYERFLILNELTKVRFQAEGMTKDAFLEADQKRNIFGSLFKKKRKVTEKDLKTYLETMEGYHGVEIVRGVKEGFNASYGTYHDLKKILPQSVLDNDKNEEILEQIIKILTLFTDQDMIRNRLQKECKSILTEKEIKALSRRSYTGWGRFSHKLIHGLCDRGSQKTILDFLWDDGKANRNFMQLITDEALSFKEQIAESQGQKVYLTNEEMVAALAGSPALKKGILQTLKIVDEIVEVMGYPPKEIIVEMAREDMSTAKGNNLAAKRRKKLEAGLKDLNSHLVKDLKNREDAELSGEKVYLYYLQDGKDLYTGEALDLDELSHYDVDHIVPRSFLKDDSIDNKVLTSRKANRGKLDDVPSADVIATQRASWNRLKKVGFITEKKYANLTKGKLTERDKEGFVNRQLVQTRQITKHLAQLLSLKFNVPGASAVDIITLKSVFANRFRSTFKLYKSRDLNDYHHAHDAYLNALVAKVLLKLYPSLRKSLVYQAYHCQTPEKRQEYRAIGKSSADERLRFSENVLRLFTVDKLVQVDTGEIIWDWQEILPIVERVLYGTSVNVVRKPEIQRGEFYDATNYPKGTGKLRPLKSHLAVEKYGGKKSLNPTYAIAFYGQKGRSKKSEWHFLSVNIMDEPIFKANPAQYLLDQGYRLVGEMYRLPKYSLFENENGVRRYLISANELQKGKQFIPLRSIEERQQLARLLQAISKRRVLRDFSEDEAKDLLAKFETSLLEFLATEVLPEKKWNSLKQLLEGAQTEPLEKRVEEVVKLLTLTEMRAASSVENFYGEAIKGHRYNSVGAPFCKTATLIQQSPTGLYETRIDLRKLGEE